MNGKLAAHVSAIATWSWY